MKAIERTVHWLFACFMMIASAFIAAFLFSLVGLKLAGIPIDPNPDPAVIQKINGSSVTPIYMGVSLCLSLMTGAFVGVISAPYVHRRIAAAVFPLLLILAFYYKIILHPTDLRPNWVFFLSIAGCLSVGLVLYIQSRRRSSTPVTAASRFADSN